MKQNYLKLDISFIHWEFHGLTGRFQSKLVDFIRVRADESVSV